jgi:hypothetical protein
MLLMISSKFRTLEQPLHLCERPSPGDGLNTDISACHDELVQGCIDRVGCRGTRLAQILEVGVEVVDPHERVVRFIALWHQSDPREDRDTP